MSDLITKMSIRYNLEKRGNKNKETNENPVKNEIIKVEVLTEEMINVFTYLGFSLEQIWIAFREYKFNSVEMGVYIMMKDPETKKYNHKFLLRENTFDENNDSFKDNKKINHLKLCAICGEAQIDHTDLNFENEAAKVQNKIIFQNLNFPSETINELEDETLCRICFSNKLDPSNKKEKLVCGHVFCIFCIENHLTIRISNGQVKDIKCLSAGCKKLFTTNEIKTFVQPNIFAKYVKFYNNQIRFAQNEHNNNTLIINCPHPDCDQVEEYVIISNQINFECGNGHKFCAKCKNEVWHEEEKCTRSEEILFQQIRDNSLSNNFKLCPSCKILIEKNGGCNQMKCIQCGYEFCWLCMNMYEPMHYALYNFTGCPGMKNYYRKKKDFWSNPIIKVLWFIFSFLFGLFIICLILFLYFFIGCPYELIKCYLERRNSVGDDDDSENSDYRNRYNEDNLPKIPIDQEIKEEGCTFVTILICILLAVVGIFLQPFYLMFYFIYAMMECYRRFNCWYLYL